MVLCHFPNLILCCSPQVGCHSQDLQNANQFEGMGHELARHELLRASSVHAIYSVWGLDPIIYLAISVLLGGSLHPMAAHFISEHYVTSPDKQETYSYYGPLNMLAFNVGYHNEHHDFPNIPWTKLPELRKIAPEYYDNLAQCDSWVWILWDFLTKRGLGPYSRVKRRQANEDDVGDDMKFSRAQDAKSE